jgi:hypothetical protein
VVGFMLRQLYSRRTNAGYPLKTLEKRWGDHLRFRSRWERNKNGTSKHTVWRWGLAHMDYEWVQSRALVNTVINHRVPQKFENFLLFDSTVRFWKTVFHRRGPQGRSTRGGEKKHPCLHLKSKRKRPSRRQPL